MTDKKKTSMDNVDMENVTVDKVEIKNTETKAISKAKAEANKSDDIERSLITAGQRRINIIWEVTQATIAITVTVTSLYVAARKVLSGDPGDAAFLLLSNAFFLIIGSYFSRTNHQKIGGIGSKQYDDQEYKGR